MLTASTHSSGSRAGAETQMMPCWHAHTRRSAAQRSAATNNAQLHVAATAAAAAAARTWFTAIAEPLVSTSWLMR